MQLAGAQVKRYKPSRKAADKRSFGEIVTRLSTATETKVPSIDGVQYLPQTVYFITPFQIDTRTLQSRFDGYVALRPRGVKIIDGVKLVSLVLERAPSIASELCGRAFELRVAVESRLRLADYVVAYSSP